MTRDGVTEEQYNWSIEQTMAVMPTMRQHLERAEQRGYDRAIAEVVAWLRSDVGKGSEAGVDYADGFADAIEAGEHKVFIK